jgi:hypothetical protein
VKRGKWERLRKKGRKMDKTKENGKLKDEI